MPVVEMRQPTPEDIDELAANLRDQDVAECHAGGHYDLRAVIADGVRRSTHCWAATIDGKLAAIVGVAPMGSMLDSRGVPWLLGTPLIPKHRRILTKVSRAYIPVMLAAYPHLANTVHADNTVAVTWLKHMGFTVHDALPLGPRGELFHPFEMSC